MDKDSLGLEVPNSQIMRYKQKRGIRRSLRKMMKRPSAVEHPNGHVKKEDRLGRNPLKSHPSDECMWCFAERATIYGCC
jgi:hypothetical protein